MSVLVPKATKGIDAIACKPPIRQRQDRPPPQVLDYGNTLEGWKRSDRLFTGPKRLTPFILNHLSKGRVANPSCVFGSTRNGCKRIVEVHPVLRSNVPPLPGDACQEGQ